MINWTGLLVLLCCSLTPVLCCDWLKHYGHLSNESLTLIQLMGGQMTEQQSPVSFPKKLYKLIKNDTVESQLVFIRDSLELIAGLFDYDNCSVTWDTDMTERFLMTIDRQTDGLNSCVSTDRRADSRLRKYYRRLVKSTLYRTLGSSASWELIRKESKRHLDRLDMLVNFMLEAQRRQLH